VTHYLAQTLLQSKSYVYISHLVKARDLYPGLLQFAIIISFSFQSASLSLLLSLFFHLYSLIVDLVEVLLRPFHSKGT
jgi:hypothetical protein